MDIISQYIAHKVQRLGFGPEFQVATTQPEEPFTSPFNFALNLDHNATPLTFFPLPRWKRDL